MIAPRRHSSAVRRAAGRPVVVACQTLEDRRLLAIAPFEANVAFQHKSSTTPGGYVGDVGKLYGEQNGLTYGWEKANVGYQLDRHSDAKQRYDGLAYLGNGESATTWEIEVPNGLYEVGVLSGDAKYTNSRYHVMAEEQTALNSKPNKARPWRTGTAIVWVSDGKLTLTAGADAVNNKINSVSIRQIDPHVTGQDVVNPFANAGLVQNEIDTDVAIPALKSLEMKTVRLWYDVKDWNDAPDRKFLKYFKEHHQAGFTVIAIFDTPSVPEEGQVKAFFERMTADSMAMQSIDFWELGNEPERGFFPGTLDQFVNGFMKPAYEVISAAGKPVIGGGASYNIDLAKQLHDLDYENYCDYVGFHPYGASGAQIVERAVGAKAIFGGKPLVVTEWNVQFQNDPDAWAEQVRLAAIGLAEVSYMNFYFAMASNDTHVGEGGIIAPDGTPNGPFYTVAQTWGAKDA